MDAAYFDKLKQVESGNNPLARNAKSSAKGYYQFIDSTASQYGLDKYQFGTPEYTKAEEEAARKLTSDNNDFLKNKLGREPTKGELYLAHQQGAGAAEKIITAPENEKAVNVLGQEEVLNNGGTQDMTIAEFKQKWVSKFDKMDAEQKGLIHGTETAEIKIDVDPLAAFGVSIGSSPDPFSDFNVRQEDVFQLSKDGVGGLKKSMIDQSTGAPSFVRQAVGSMADPESRLATLRKYYPDAQSYDNENFVYTDPETKRPTLYNPVGFDRGDVASVTKEIFTTAGSSVGAVVGGAIGGGGGLLLSVPTGGAIAPATVPSGVIKGSVIGAGVGAGVASNLWDAWMNLSGQTVDVRGLPQIAAETAVEVAGGAGGEYAGRVIPVMAKEAIGGAKTTSRAIMRQFERVGITPTIGVVQKGTGAKLESALSQNIMSSELMQNQVDNVILESNTALNKIISQYGAPKTTQGAGGTIVKAAEKAVVKYEDKISKLYDTAFDLIGADTIVKTDSTSSLLKEMSTELSAAPASRSKAYAPAVNMLKSIVADAQTGIDFKTLRAIRTDIGRDLADPLSSGATSSQNAAMKRVYAALTDDMTNVATEAGDSASKAMSRADNFKRAFETTSRDTLNKILKYDAEEKAYKFAISASKDGGTSLSKLRKLFTKEEWDDVSATVLSQLGDAPANGGFSIDRFVTNYNKLAPEAKDALFRGGKYKQASQALDEYVDLMGMLKDAKRFNNTSNTAGAIQTNMILWQLGGLAATGAGGALTGEQMGVGSVMGAAGAILAPRVAAKLITNPEFVRWLAEPVTQGAIDVTTHLTKLVAIGMANPEIKEDIDQLISVMERNTTAETTTQKQ